MSYLIALATAAYNFIDNRKIDTKKALSKNYKVSVIVPTYNEKNNIANTIRHIMAQEYPHMDQLYVLDDCSTDGTTAIVDKFSKLYPGKLNHVVSEKNVGKTANINKLLYEKYDELSDIVWFVDSDIETKPEQLTTIMKYFDKEEVAAVTGRCWPKKPKKWQGHKAKLIYHARSRNYDINAWKRRWQMRRDAMYVLVGANFAVKKEHIKNGIPKRVDTEDLDLCWKLQEEGYRINAALEIKSKSMVPLTIKDYYKQILRWNTGSLQSLWIHRKELKKAKSLSITTLLPSYVGAYFSAAYRATIPVVAFFDPIAAGGLFALDVAQSTLFNIVLSRENIGRIPSYLLHSYIASATWVHGGVKVLSDIIRGQTERWGSKSWKRVSLTRYE